MIHNLNDFFNYSNECFFSSYQWHGYTASFVLHLTYVAPVDLLAKYYWSMSMSRPHLIHKYLNKRLQIVLYFFLCVKCVTSGLMNYYFVPYEDSYIFRVIYGLGLVQKWMSIFRVCKETVFLREIFRFWIWMCR